MAPFTNKTTLRNYDGDGNEDVKEAIGLMNKTTILHVYHAFLYISFAVPAKRQREMTKF